LEIQIKYLSVRYDFSLCPRNIWYRWYHQSFGADSTLYLQYYYNYRRNLLHLCRYESNEQICRLFHRRLLRSRK